MWWESLAFVDALHAEGTMAGAARRLGVDRATVSRRIADIERSAPAPLFERCPGGLELTKYGTHALAAFRAHEASSRRFVAALESAETEPRGLVRITMPSFACSVFTSGLPEFLQNHSEISVQIDGTNRVVDLTRDEADVALRGNRPTDAGLAMRKVGQLALGVYASPQYLERRGRPGPERSLLGHDLLSHQSSLAASLPGLDWWPAAAAQTRTVFVANDFVVLRDAVASGLGLAVLPRMLGDHTERLERLPEAGGARAPIWLVTREEQRRVPRIRTVAQYLVEGVRGARDLLDPSD